MSGSLARVATDDARWLAFLEQRAEATIFHHPAWSGLAAACYGFTPLVLCALDGAGSIVAGLPVAEVVNLGRRRWVALPYADEVAPLVDPEGKEQFTRGVEEARLARGGVTLEVHGSLAGGTQRARGVSHALALTPDSGSLRRGLSSQHRRQLARARQHAVSITVRRDRDALLGVFFALHLETRRRQGVPIQPRRFFETLWSTLIDPGLGEVMIAEVDRAPVAAVVVLRFGRTATYKFGASNDAARRVGANHALLWAAIEAACEGGYDVFDFGRTDLGNEGLRRYKAGFGAVERPLLHTWLGAVPRTGSGRAQATLGPAIRHSPAWVCRAAGSVLYRFAA